MSNVKITLDTTRYRIPTQDEVDKAKQYALNRGRTANLVVRKLNDRLSQSTKDLVSIGYKYNVEGVTFQWNSVPSMYEEVTELMDKVYEDCMAIIEDKTGLKKNSLFADFQAVKSGQVYTTGSNFYQQSTGTCDFIEDLNQILTGEGDGTYRFLKQLQ